MKKHYYKKYYDNHREQEKKRTNAYYHEHREEVLAKRKAKRDAEPKVYKPTLREQLKIAEKALELACNWIDVNSWNDCGYEEKAYQFFKNKAKEELNK